MEQLGKSPLGGVDPATPINCFEAGGVGLGGDLFGFGVSAMIAPEVILVQRGKFRLGALTDGNHT